MQDFTLPRAMRRDGMIQRIAAFLARLPDDKAWRISVEQAKSTRSIQQCRFLNGCIYKILSEATGYERDDISAYCCGLYWGWVDKRVPRTPRNPEGIESVPVRTTTTDETGNRDVLKWDEFAEYVAFLQRHFAQIKNPIYLPDPDPSWREHEQQEAA